MKKLLILILLVSITTLSQAHSWPNFLIPLQVMNSDWKTLVQPEYSIKYLTTWELDQSGQMGSSFILFSSLESADDQFRDNINLLVQNLEGLNIDLDAFTSLSEEQIQSFGENAKLFESTRVKTKKVEYQKIIYASDMDVYKLKFEQYYFVQNEKAYILTFTAEQSKFDYYLALAEEMMNSFKLKK
jgi:hypothetical protein